MVSAGSSQGNQTAVRKDSSLLSAPEKSSCGQPEATQLPESKRPSPAPAEQSPGAGEKPPAALGHASHSSQSPKKAFSSVIEHLWVVFPCYSSTELAGFIKKVRNKNKNSLSGLSVDEIVQRVTEHILDEQTKKKPNPGKDKRTSEASSSQGPASAAVGPSSPRAKDRKTDDVPMSAASSANSCEICHEVFQSKNMRVLKCGHKFHKGCFKQWLKEQNGCPACHSRDLQAEE